MMKTVDHAAQYQERPAFADRLQRSGQRAFPQQSLVVFDLHGSAFNLRLFSPLSSRSEKQLQIETTIHIWFHAETYFRENRCCFVPPLLTLPLPRRRPSPHIIRPSPPQSRSNDRTRTRTNSSHHCAYRNHT